MLQKPLIKLRDLKELQCSQKKKAENDEFITPFKVKKPRKPRTSVTKTKKPSPIAEDEQQPAATTANTVVAVAATPKTVSKRVAKSARKEPPPSQLRINSFFKTCEKSYKIEPIKEEPPTPISKKAATEVKAKAKRASTTRKNTSSPTKRSRKMGRKRLFVDETSESDNESQYSFANSGGDDKKASVKQPKTKTSECITIISDSDEEELANKNLIKTEDVMKNKTAAQDKTPLPIKEIKQSKATKPNKSATLEDINNGRSKITATTSPSTSKRSGMTRDSPTTTSGPCTEIDDLAALTRPVGILATPHGSSTVTNSKTPATTKRKPKPCPPYKIVEGTSFAVDGFQYGCIADVTHYFLTHFHADHYIGLTRKFAMPLYMSTITARLVRTFIPIDEQYIHVLELHTPIIVNDVEITALDANHCPGAIMLLFKFPHTGKCILHTGDFRAWHGMESEPFFWNNDINTIYLDTTYISNNYAFCTQYESIDKAKSLIDTFREKHSQSRILYVCGSYVIGKEKFWSAIAEEYELKVWTEENRSKALKSMDDPNLNRLLVDDPRNADMHVIAMGKISYLSLVEYFTFYEHEYDKLLAIRPSGWEKDSKPQYRGKINIVGVEYSEHSSYEEMQRFVKFLKPQKVISTVPTGRDLMKTAIVPEKWYKYDKLQSSSNYQPRIEQYMGKTPRKKSAIRLPNERKGGLETFVSPLKNKPCRNKTEINNNCEEEAIVSIKSSENEIEQSSPGHTNPFAIQEIKNNVNKTKEKAVVKQEYKERLKKDNKILQSSTQRAKRRIKNELSSPDNKSELIISQTLNDGDSCSIFIPTTSAIQSVSRANSSDFFESPRYLKKNGCSKEIASTSAIQQVSSTNSSEYFEPTTSKARLCKAKDRPASAEEIPVSQKRNTRLASKQTKAPSVASTMDEDELEFHMQMLKKSQMPIPTTKQHGKLVSQTNPLLKSTTTSYASSTNEDVAASEICMDLEKTTNAVCNKIFSQNEQIPASQTTNDLANTPRPLRNRIKIACSQMQLSQNEQISASQTTNDLANTPRPLRNKMKLAYMWQTTAAEDDVIPASQSTEILRNTPRPLRNKRKSANNSCVLTTSPQKRNRKSPVNNRVPTTFTQNRPLTQILEENGQVDIYNMSQAVEMVVNAMAQQEHDTSVDHIPSELLSSSQHSEESDVIVKVERDSEVIHLSLDSDQQHCVDSKEDEDSVDLMDVYNKSKLVNIVVDALSQRQPDKSVDHIPPELLSPTDQDAEDDWLY